MLNRIILIGRLTRDPESKVIPSGVSVTTFSIAVNRFQSAEARQAGQEKQTDFIDIVAWRQTAEYVANYIQKGRLVAVEGKLQIREYVTAEGQKRKAAEVVADNVQTLERGQDGDGDNQGGGGGGGGYANNSGGGYGNNQSRGGGDEDYTQAPAAAPARSGGGGNYGNSGGGNSGNSGGGNRPAPAAGGNRRPAAPPANDFDDNDGLSDPFAE